MKIEDKIDLYLNESIQSYAKSLINDLKKLSKDKAKQFLKKQFKKFANLLKKNGLEKDFLKILNKKLKTRYNSLDQLTKLNENELNEDFKHFGEMFRNQGGGAVIVFPTLSLGFEFDRLLEGAGITDLNFKKIMVYGTLGVVLVLSGHISGGKKGKKENPEEYEKEGKPGPFTIRKK